MDDGQRFDAREDLPCVEFVELITAYLEDALPDDVSARVDAHLEVCPGCPNALDQLRTVVDLTGRLTESDVEELDPLEREALMSVFWRLRRR
jgi:anti-sigma factor RsiW